MISAPFHVQRGLTAPTQRWAGHQWRSAAPEKTRVNAQPNVLMQIQHYAIDPLTQCKYSVFRSEGQNNGKN